MCFKEVHLINRYTSNLASRCIAISGAYSFLHDYHFKVLVVLTVKFVVMQKEASLQIHFIVLNIRKRICRRKKKLSQYWFAFSECLIPGIQMTMLSTKLSVPNLEYVTNLRLVCWLHILIDLLPSFTRTFYVLRVKRRGFLKKNLLPGKWA